jgi:hypothetical protein
VAFVGRLMVNLTSFEVQHFSCWTPKSRDGAKLSKQERCPYCIERDEFRLMFRTPRGWIACQTCGHIIIPEEPDFKCLCRKCKALNCAA